jgi:hypothetical protein
MAERECQTMSSLLDTALEAIRGLGYDTVKISTLTSPDTQDSYPVYVVGRHGSRHVIVVKDTPDGFRAFVPVALPDNPEAHAEAQIAWLVENVGLAEKD